MSAFEHVAVLISIVIGLGIAQILTDTHRLVQARARVQLYWLPIFWAVVVFIAMVEWWWAAFQLRSLTDWNFGFFLFLLLSPVTLYLASAWILPDIGENESVDMRQYYYGTGRFFFALLGFSTALDAVRRGMMAGSFTDFGAWSNAVSALFVGSLAFTKKPTYHVGVTILVAALFTIFLLKAALQLS